MPHDIDAPRPNLKVAARVEELLSEQLEEMGVNPRKLAPEEIAANMRCHIAPDNSLTYLWKGEPILYVTPEKLTDENGEESVLWRMFTKDDMADDEAGTADSFLADAADYACEDDDDEEDDSPVAPLQ